MKKNIKVIVIMAFYIGLVLLNTRVYASTGKIINDLVRIRQKPSINSEIVEVLSIGEKIEITGKDGEWYKVKYNTLTGYVREDMVSVDKSSENKSDEKKETDDKSSENTESENKTEENKTSEGDETKKETNTIDDSKTNKVVTEEVKENETIALNSDVNVRILPLVNSSKIGVLKAKTNVFVSEKIGNWSYIETDKLSGWVQSSKLTKTEDSSEKKNSDDTKKSEENETKKKSDTVEEKTMYVSVTALNVRKEPKTDAEVIDQLLQNDTVKVIENVDNTWSKVRISGRIGYVATKYLSTKKTETTSRERFETRAVKTEDNNTNTDTNIAKKDETKKEETKTEVKTETKTEAKTEVKKETKTETQKSSSNTSGKVTGEDVVAYAKKFLGCKYVYATAGPKTFDCSGFTTYVYKHFGYSLNRVANDQQKNGVAVKKSDLQAGDIVCFRGHVGIYIGSGKFIHAENSRTGVVISSLSQKYYTNNYVTARRILK